MSLAENKSLVRRYEDLWNRWDFALADELLGEGLIFRGSLGMTVEGRRTGRETTAGRLSQRKGFSAGGVEPGQFVTGRHG
jgi:hypothetical protein